MTWLLVTNACIRYLNGRAPNLKARIDAAKASDLVVCSIVKAELYFGATRSAKPEKALRLQEAFLAPFVSYSFDDRCAAHYGRIRGSLAAQGTPIGPNDLLIASIALANDLTLVTHNTQEFCRVADLRIEDREAD